jgi:hypothetical protein
MAIWEGAHAFLFAEYKFIAFFCVWLLRHHPGSAWHHRQHHQRRFHHGGLHDGMSHFRYEWLPRYEDWRIRKDSDMLTRFACYLRGQVGSS